MTEGPKWNRARNRDRNEARFKIRERIAAVCGSNQNEIRDEATSTSSRDLPHNHELIIMNRENFDQSQQMQSFFNSVSKGSASAFSLKTISIFYSDLSSPLDPVFMSTFKITTLCTSRFGKEFADFVLMYKAKIKCCSLIEYASLIGEYGVVSALLAGGINPCYLREDEPAKRVEKDTVSKLAMQKLVADLIPSSLAVYVIRSLFVMKMLSVAKIQSDAPSFSYRDRNVCPLCTMVTTEPLLTFAASCNHQCCEICMWNHILLRIDEYSDGNVVRCPTCETTFDYFDPDKSKPMLVDANSNLSPMDKNTRSRTLFYLLPTDKKGLKSLPKKGKAKNKIHADWLSALIPTIGSSQDVRRDKFFRYVNLGAIHHCHACLQAGIDVNFTNEYNQSECVCLFNHPVWNVRRAATTPLRLFYNNKCLPNFNFSASLYIACWRNNVRLVRLLLEWGADPDIQAAGKMCIMNVTGKETLPLISMAISKSGETIFDTSTTLERRLSIIESKQEDDNCSKIEQGNKSELNILIPNQSDHPGAGSCYIDHSMMESTLQLLDQLWSILPVASSADIKKKKTNATAPCSDRYYFCDAEGVVCKALKNCIERTLNDSGPSSIVSATIFPHMRFLCYTKGGSVLSPHVDLFKKDWESGKRSTHTFILYLRDCKIGGETALLKELSSDGPMAQHEVMASISPKRGRLLLFPHTTPHEGSKVVSTPKLLLRGEVLLQ